jgi:hypothetical protein
MCNVVAVLQQTRKVAAQQAGDYVQPVYGISGWRQANAYRAVHQIMVQQGEGA